MIARLVDGGIEIPDDELRAIIKESVSIKPEISPTNVDLSYCAAHKGVKESTLKSEQLQQPLLGYSRWYHGKKKFYPYTEYERWLSVFDYNMAEYIEELLTGDDQNIVLGVQAQVIKLRQAGRVNDQLFRQIKHLISIQGVA